MKRLFWKECYELRFLPLGAALAVAVMLAADRAYNHYYGIDIAYKSGFLQYVYYVWLLFAALAGSGTISQEIGTGTLQFLSSLPVRRRTLWWVKASVALGMLLLSLLTSTLTWLMLCDVWYPSKALSLDVNVWYIVVLTLAFMLNTFAVALAVSTFFDRPLSAACASILLSMGIAGLFSSDLPQWLSVRNPEHLIYTLVGLGIPTSAAISYWTFTRGETLRGQKRFIVAGITGGVCVGISLVILATASAFGAWY